MMRHSPDLGRLDLGSASDWSCGVGNLIQPIRSTTQIWGVTRHQYGIFVLVSLRRNLAGKQVVASPNVRCFLRLNVVQLCLVAKISGSCVNKTTLFSFLESLLREKWQIASLPKMFIKKKTW